MIALFIPMAALQLETQNPNLIPILLDKTEVAKAEL